MFGGMGGNMAGMMKKVQKVQAQMQKMQEELKKRTVEVSVGGGVVKVTMNGEKQVEALSIDKAAKLNLSYDGRATFKTLKVGDRNRAAGVYSTTIGSNVVKSVVDGDGELKILEGSDPGIVIVIR